MGCVFKPVIVLWTLFILGAFFIGSANVGEMINKGQASESIGGFAILFSIVVHSVVWAVVVVPAYLLMNIFSKKEHPASKLCSLCGKYHNSDGKFCPNCGKAIG